MTEMDRFLAFKCINNLLFFFFFLFSSSLLRVRVRVYTEREVCQTAGPAAQLAANRSVNVPQQFPGFVAGEAHGPQVYSRPPHFHHFLPHEGTRTTL